MAQYTIEIAPAAAKEYRKLDKPVQKKVSEEIDKLANEPPRERLTGYPFYKIRKGDYRIVYDISDTTIMVLVLRIAHGREVYKDLDRIKSICPLK
ncbi:MAG: type II toxin-antitoxin system RelE/ParE family toxin [Myxococcales bacterium]|nr:MAG: type II toxin-antitoxin system RelE/ParE family toxin [Myxococcales bacterium]